MLETISDVNIVVHDAAARIAAVQTRPRSGDEEEEKVTQVGRPHTSVDPGTVMIEASNAMVAHTAMLRPRWSDECM